MNIKASIIIPTFDGYRKGNLEKLVDDIKNQDFKDYELILVKGISPNGRARNLGVKEAKGKFLVFIDDDTLLGNNKVLGNLIKPLAERKDIGITGTSRYLPPTANYFQRLVQRQIPRSGYPQTSEITDSDMATHDCMAIPKELYEKVGGEHNFLVRGTDPDLRHRVRCAGYRVVVVPHTWIYHPQPENLSQFIKKAFRNGMGAAWVFKNYPGLTYEVPEGDKGKFSPKRSFIYRYIRRIFDLFISLLTFKLLRFLMDFFYIAGYVWGLFLSNERLEKVIY